jgi:hypothetical protein
VYGRSLGEDSFWTEDFRYFKTRWDM